MITYLYDQEDKSKNTIKIYHSTTLALTPIYALFLNCYADLIDKKYIEPVTSYTDKNTEVIWAEHNDKVVGFLTFKNDAIDEWYLNQLFLCYVVLDYRNKGIFNILLKEFENISKIRNCTYYKICISENDHDTFGLMKKFGLSTYFYLLHKDVQ